MVADRNDEIREGFKRLAQIAGGLNEGPGVQVHVATVRELLRWFGAERRDDRTVFEISTALRHLDLRTEPWFEDQFTDGPLKFQRGYFGGSHVPTPTDKMVLDFVEKYTVSKDVAEVFFNNLRAQVIKHRVKTWIDQFPEGQLTPQQVQEKVNELATLDFKQFSKEEVDDAIYVMSMEFETEGEQAERQDDRRGLSAELEKLPQHKAPGFAAIPETTLRIRRLPCANRAPVRIVPNRNINEAISTMLLRDFSQLPVMSGEREVKGIVSLKSILACWTRAANLQGEVREYMDTPAFEISIDTPLLDAIGDIVHHQYALIRDKGKITGIVTVSDLNEEFRQLSEPFLILYQIENHIRALITRVPHEKLNNLITRVPHEKLNNLTKFVDFEPPDRRAKTIFDLDFGDYLRLLRDSENWERLELLIDKGIFNRELDRVREIRNDVMHFVPDPIADEKLKALQDFVGLLRTLEPRKG